MFTGAASSIKIDAEFNLVVGIKTDMVMGLAVKIVPILDASILGWSLKFALVDQKFAITDTKSVIVDSKSYFVEMKNGAVKEKTTAVNCNTAALKSGLGVMKSNIQAALKSDVTPLQVVT